MSSERAVVRAAGCVVWRPGPGGEPQVLLVHRPAPHDDWSLPKGKLDPGESHRHAAVREVREETGWSGELGEKLSEVRYELSDGSEKRIRWWAMRATHDGGFAPNREIDDRRWVTLDQAPALLTWDSDRTVLVSFTSATP